MMTQTFNSERKKETELAAKETKKNVHLKKQFSFGVYARESLLFCCCHVCELRYQIVRLLRRRFSGNFQK